MKKTISVCLLGAAGLLAGACAMPQSSNEANGEAMEQVYITGSNIPRKQRAGTADAVSTQSKEDAERVLTSPTLPPLPIPGGR